MLGLSSILLFNFFLHVFCNSTKTSANSSDRERERKADCPLAQMARRCYRYLCNPVLMVGKCYRYKEVWEIQVHGMYAVAQWLTTPSASAVPLVGHQVTAPDGGDQVKQVNTEERKKSPVGAKEGWERRGCARI